MSNIDSDIKFLINTFDGTGDFEYWHKIYPRTTEDLCKIFKKIDIENKDVYTVLSSSDPFFSLICMNPKSIRTFDINPLTYRYYFLRKWMLEKRVVDGKELSYDEILSIISHQRNYMNKDEEESVKLWNLYISKQNREWFRLYSARLFQYVESRYNCPYDDKIDFLNERLNNYNLQFENIDIYSDEINSSQAYDVVFLSNIMDLNDTDHVRKIRDNIYGILKSNASVICTNLITHPYFDLFNWQRKVFEEKFFYEEIYRESVKGKSITYYRYIKK